MKIPLYRVWVIVIASAIIVLAWLKERKKEEDRRLATCRCGTPAMVSSNVNDLVADENTRE